VDISIKYHTKWEYECKFDIIRLDDYIYIDIDIDIDIDLDVDIDI